MDYEKAYKYALDLAKQVHDTTISKQQKENIEIIFPELCESEDEKMREELIRSFKSLNTIEIWNGTKRSDILAWLEKQDSTWSEEDEQIVLSIEQVMACASLLNIVPEKIDKIRTWLKSLKERIGG